MLADLSATVILVQSALANVKALESIGDATTLLMIDWMNNPGDEAIALFELTFFVGH